MNARSTRVRQDFNVGSLPISGVIHEPVSTTSEVLAYILLTPLCSEYLHGLILLLTPSLSVEFGENIWTVQDLCSKQLESWFKFQQIHRLDILRKVIVLFIIDAVGNKSLENNKCLSLTGTGNFNGDCIWIGLTKLVHDGFLPGIKWTNRLILKSLVLTVSRYDTNLHWSQFVMSLWTQEQTKSTLCTIYRMVLLGVISQIGFSHFTHNLTCISQNNICF